ncbi:hypothetical protein HELRODRAFT_164799 [Helobdella robusta]|uniref:Uncharacterized protein n=1 Tax=Helobdella robusta TaxID=6412 RepID=T1EVT7_HELRO|nr:hypothetical protein HELRODRAFT_164799 [Helobdella robusta]ESN92703.1 hypothetical protein HELRODRAFT_164799 [Helobdella robusta]
MQTKCGCFTPGLESASSLIFQGSGQNCSAQKNSFICCENYSYISDNKFLCCLDKYEQSAPAFVEKCRLTDQQLDAIEKLFGPGSSIFHRSIYKKYTTTDDDFAIFHRSGLLYAMVLLCCFLAVPVLCFCFKTFVENLEQRYGVINHQRLAGIGSDGTHLTDNRHLSVLNQLGPEQRTLNDAHSYLPFAVQPPSYNSIPKEPPRYSSIFLIDSHRSSVNRSEENSNHAVDEAVFVAEPTENVNRDGGVTGSNV